MTITPIDGDYVSSEEWLYRRIPNLNSTNPAWDTVKGKIIPTPASLQFYKKREMSVHIKGMVADCGVTRNDVYQKDPDQPFCVIEFPVSAVNNVNGQVLHSLDPHDPDIGTTHANVYGRETVKISNEEKTLIREAIVNTCVWVRTPPRAEYIDESVVSEEELRESIAEFDHKLQGT